MIPKKIHYCWLSNDAMPEKIQRCIESWRKNLPDYEIVKWDLEKFPLEKNIWVRQAYERKKYAFAADYIRLYALVTEGGIYLDSDVEVLKPFDDLLHLPYFVCKENGPQRVEAATIGAEARTSWLVKSLEYYDGKTFVDSNGKEQTTVLPLILQDCISRNFKIIHIDSPLEFIFEENTVCVLPTDYFSPKSYVTKKVAITENTYSIHHFAGSWQPGWERTLRYLWIHFSIIFPSLAAWLKRKVVNRIKERLNNI